MRKAFVLPFLILCINKSDGIFKMTKVECIVENKDYGNFSYCRLKPVRRDVAEFSVKFVLTKRVYDCQINAELLRKYNRFAPFGINYTIDACAFMKNGKNYKIISIAHDIYKDFTNMNHSCPYEGEIIVDKFIPEHNKLRLPIPTGEYLFKTNWMVQQKLVARLNIWVSFTEV